MSTTAELFKEIDILHKSLEYLAYEQRNSRDTEKLQIVAALSKLARTRVLEVLGELEQLL